MRITSQADIPDLSGKIALVTGATGGIGLETARMLAQAGAHVILAGRNADKGVAAMRDIAASKIKGHIEFERFDMADLADVAAAAARITAMHAQIDILVNNAGVMMPPQRKTTTDGYELQFGTNHLAHFALTGRLLQRLQEGRARVVMVSSNAARRGRMAFEDLQSERRYSPWRAYGQSKLANLLFMRSLQEASNRNGWGLSVLASHPGLSSTGLISSGMGNGPAARIGGFFNKLVAQSAFDGALPSVAAAADMDLAPLSFVGPDGAGGWRGKPTLVKLPPAAEDDAAARRLWEVSENLTGVRFGD
ncbi:oxidoreductase [Devosia submarina]|uniref:oxidoreductase n=1 Tax=Devosia submarina TaxID=1173082 RepID=UPI000D3B6E76|nr:oxidoreductase [Devosia submarina]